METTLPYSWYTDPEILRREEERILTPAWQYVGHTGQLARARLLRRRTWPARPVVVTRDARRRAARLRQRLPPPRLRARRGRAAPRDAAVPVPRVDVRARRRLRAAPRSDEEPGFPQDELGLVPVAVDTWGPFVFANAGADPEPLARGARLAARAGRGARARRRLARPPLPLGGRGRGELEDRRARTSSSATTARSPIPASARSSTSRPRRTCSRPTGASRPSTARCARRRPADELPRAQFHFLWPNLGINIFPGRPNISIGPIVPLAPERTYRFLDYFFGPDVEPGLDRRPPRLRRPGRTGGPGARRGRAARRRIRRASSTACS